MISKKFKVNETPLALCKTNNFNQQISSNFGDVIMKAD